MPKPVPATCAYLPRPCTAPAAVLIWYRVGSTVRHCAVCKQHERYVENAVQTVHKEQQKKC